jgi:hypothetical protein
MPRQVANRGHTVSAPAVESGRQAWVLSSGVQANSLAHESALGAISWNVTPRYFRIGGAVLIAATGWERHCHHSDLRVGSFTPAQITNPPRGFDKIQKRHGVSAS